MKRTFRARFSRQPRPPRIAGQRPPFLGSRPGRVNELVHRLFTISELMYTYSLATRPLLAISAADRRRNFFCAHELKWTSLVHYTTGDCAPFWISHDF